MESQQFDHIAAAICALQQDPTLTLQALAAAAGMSAAHFQRVFAAWAGVSPKRFAQYVQRQRLQALLGSASDVLELSHAAGLSSPGRLHDLVVTCDAMTPGELLRAGAGVTVTWGVVKTPFGGALIGQTSRGICFWHFFSGAPAETPEETLKLLECQWPGASLERNDAVVQAMVDRALAPSGNPQPLHLLLRGSNFQLRVWQALLQVPSGQVATYGDIANLIASPGAARAVGSAVAQNSIAWLIPCHRIIRASGESGEYRWGAQRKLALLGWEQSRRDATP